MNQFSEDELVEQTAINLIKEVWSDKDCHINAYNPQDDALLGRDNQGEVVLKKYLQPALKKLNPTVPETSIEEAIEQLTRERSHLSIVKANREIYRILRDGYSINVGKEDGSHNTITIKYIDYDNPSNNSYLCVSQLWIVGDMHKRRPDLVLFVNGIPLILVELKASHISLVDAYNKNIRDYKDTIPQLFWYNLGIIISNGIENRIGTITSPYEFFNEWKKVTGESDQPKKDLATLIHGACNKNRLLDIFENFVLFDESKGEIRKIIPRYFQYFGVNTSFNSVLHRKENNGKLGVFWHTQGSGKTFSMVYLSQKVLRKVAGNFTFVIVTDRKELDKQAYENFANVGAVYEKHVHAESIKDLHELLTEDHRQVFTTIQKFQDIDGPISSRDDIIVMTDEAHRTQYDQMAMNMRKALPNASFIGFTGTPLLADGEEKTRETFGDYVSVYNFGQSVEDGATVPLYYENRVPRLENVNENLEKDIGKVMDFYDLNDEEEEKLEKEFSTFYHIVTREDRLNTIARDIVEHFVGRGYDGKAMVVSIDKKTAARMYTKVKAEWQRYLGKLRVDLSHTTDERERERILQQLERHENVDMAVVVSQSQNEISDLEQYEIDMRPLRQRMLRENLEDQFKKPDTNLKIVFVCAMWMTGFDVPTLSTLYLDKPLKNHTLMQTIARANRVASGKKNGLIVDYIGVFRNIERALALYAAHGADEDDIIKDKDELIDELSTNIEQTAEYLHSLNINFDQLLQAPGNVKLQLLDSYANTILQKDEIKDKFLDLARDVASTYTAILPDPDADKFSPKVTAINVIASRVRDIGIQSVDVSQIKKELEGLLDKSIHAGEYVIYQPKKLKDLSLLDAEKLRDFFAKLENKNLQVESLKSELEQKITDMMKKNKRRARFMERFIALLNEYNTGAHDIDRLFDELIKLSHDLDEEEQRAVKENMSEEELAIFDLLFKDNLDPDERERVRSASRELLKKLKDEKFVLDWWEKDQTRAGVKTTIYSFLYDSLPEPAYTQEECDTVGNEVYNYVYETYRGQAIEYSREM